LVLSDAWSACENYSLSHSGQMYSSGHFGTLGRLECLRELQLKSQWLNVLQWTLWYSRTLGVSARVTT